MKDTIDDAKIFFLGILVGFICIIPIVGLFYEKGLKSGEIAAKSGHSRYVLTTQPNGEVIWKSNQNK